jgi:iron complex outermembrane receptor protein
VNTYRAFYENPNLIGSYNVMESSFDGKLDNLNGNVNIFGSYHVESASYFLLDNMQIGYNLPIADGSAFQKARFFITGQNLFVISGYSGVSPEIRFSDGDGGVLAPGIDRRNTWFRTRTFQAGVQLGF